MKTTQVFLRSPSPWSVKTLLIAASFALFTGVSHSASQLKVTNEAWAQLNADERTALTRLYSVEILARGSVGKIVDAQAVNESTPGTNAGAMLGGAIGSAAYIDRAFSGNNNYSALGNLGVALVGMFVGSMLDKPAETKFHTRYTIRLFDGSLHYHDELSSSQFRKSVGDCVSIPDWQSVNTNICETNTEYYRKLISSRQAGEDVITIPTQMPLQPLVASTEPARREVPLSVKTSTLESAPEVLCKIGDSMPIKISQQDCEISNGVRLQ